MSDLMGEIGELAGSEFFGDSFESSPAPEAPAAPDTPEFTIDGSGRAHGEDGKFVSLAEPEVPQAEAEDTEEAPEDSGEEEVPADAETAPEAESDDEVVLEIDDDEVLAFLDKYDGDVVKALKAATEGQKLVGRQGQELGDLRKALSEDMDDRLSAMQAAIISQTVNWEEQIEDNPRRAADLALRVGHGDALVAALQAWAEEEDDESGPQMFLRMAQAEMALQEAYMGPQTEQTESFDDVMAGFKAKHPDVVQHLPTIQKIVAERPTLARSLAEGTPRERALALEDALLLARGQSAATDTPAAARRVILRAKQEADAAKAAAVVESASKSSAASAGPSPDEVLQADLRTLTGLDDLTVV